MLIHFMGHPMGQKESLTGYTEKFLEVAVRYPNVNFIIAHSGMSQFVGLKGLRIVGEFFNSHPNLKRNVYTDTSTAIGNVIAGSTERLPEYLGPDAAKWEDRLPSDKETIEGWQKNSDIVQAWEDFGMDYVLFGSDWPIWDIRSEYKNLVLNPLVSEENKARILRTNGQRLFRELGIQN